MNFLNRAGEIKALERAFAKKSSIAVIYGRRRLGKTELIKKFIKEKNAVYYLATKEDDAKQLKSISSLVGLKINDEELARFGAVDWEAFFLRIKNRKSASKLVIAVDEFPYLVKSNNAIPSIFQKGWDAYLNNANIMLILSGSSMSMMQNETISYNAPLYGRSEVILKMKQLNIEYALNLNTTMRFEDRLLTYFILGGVPGYYNFIEEATSFRQVLKQIFKTGSVFLEEPSILLSEEFKKETTYMKILDLIASGVNKTNKIASKLNIQPSNVVKYLEALERVDIIKKVFPVTEKPVRKSKKSVYVIRDNYLSFWFKFVKNNMEFLNIQGTDATVEKVIKEFNSYSGRAFENFAIEFLKSTSNEKFQISSIGKWWGVNLQKPKDKNQEEIGIIALNNDKKEILFAECKWSNNTTGVEAYNEIKRKAKLVQWFNNERKEHYVFFSKTGFTEEMKKLSREENIMLFDIPAIQKTVEALSKQTH
jgi:AAA+ ATPase superfamily predicted ATPase